MKKRVIKKLISRYIKPAIKDLPKTDCHCWDEQVSEFVYRVRGGRNYSLVNGHAVLEGRRLPQLHLTPAAFRKTAELIYTIRDYHGEAFFRSLSFSKNRLRVRIITDRAEQSK